MHMLPSIVAVPLVAVPCGVVAGLCIRRWPHSDLLAPRIEPTTVTEEARHRPRLRALLRSRMDPATETGLLLSVAVVAVVVSLTVVGVVAEMVRSKRGLAAYDLRFADWAALHATPSSTHQLRTLSQLGGYVTVTIIAFLVAGIEHRRHLGRSVVPMLVLVVGGQFAVTNAIKFTVDRARPAVSQLTGYAGTSFPSGHAAAAAASYAVFALLLTRRRSPLVKAIGGGVAVAIATGVAATRVLLGVHWLTDVVAGLFVGWAWFVLLSMAFGGRVLRFGDTLRKAADQLPAQRVS